jgi:hypothetical protein
MRMTNIHSGIMRGTYFLRFSFDRPINIDFKTLKYNGAIFPAYRIHLKNDVYNHRQSKSLVNNNELICFCCVCVCIHKAGVYIHFSYQPDNISTKSYGQDVSGLVGGHHVLYNQVYSIYLACNNNKKNACGSWALSVIETCKEKEREKNI